MDEKLLIIIYISMAIISLYDIVKIIKSKNYKKKWVIIANDVLIIISILVFTLKIINSNEVDVTSISFASQYLQNSHIILVMFILILCRFVVIGNKFKIKN